MLQSMGSQRVRHNLATEQQPEIEHLQMLMVVMSGQMAGDFSSSLFLLVPVSMRWAYAVRKSLLSLTHSSILAWEIS